MSTQSFDGLLLKGIVAVALASATGCATVPPAWHGQTAVAVTVSGEAPKYYVQPILSCSFSEYPRTCYLGVMPRIKARRMSQYPIAAPGLLYSLPIDSVSAALFVAFLPDDSCHLKFAASMRPPIDAEAAVAQVLAELDVSRRFGSALAVVAHEPRFQRIQVVTAPGAGAETQGATSTVAPYPVPVQLFEIVLALAGNCDGAKLSAEASVGGRRIAYPEYTGDVPVTIPSEQLSTCMHGDAQACAPYFDDLLKRLARAVLVEVDWGLYQRPR